MSCPAGAVVAPASEWDRSSHATLPELVAHRPCAKLFCAVTRDCWSVELRALCNEVPRTPPGPEGSNGTGITSGAADYPKFLAWQTAVPDQTRSRIILSHLPKPPSAFFSWREWLSWNSDCAATSSLIRAELLPRNLELFLRAGTCETRTHELSSDCEEVASAEVCGSGRTGACDGNSGECHQKRPR